MTKENFDIVSALMKIYIPKKLIAIVLIIGNSMLNAEDVSSEIFEKLDRPLTEIGFKQDSVISSDGVEINYFISGSIKKRWSSFTALVAVANTGWLSFNISQNNTALLRLILPDMVTQEQIERFTTWMHLGKMLHRL
jgi:hypothetical protein